MRKILAGLSLTVLALSLAACGGDAVAADSVYANVGAKVGISMPTKESARWIADGNAMVAQFKAMGYQAELQYADNKKDLQNQQVDKMIGNGDQLLLIAAVDGGAMNDVLAKAASKKIPVIAYDRLLTGTKNVDYQATFDNTRVGALQGQFIIDRLDLTKKDDKTYNVELFAGSATDINARYFYDGAMPLLRPYIKTGKIKIRSGETAFKKVATNLYDAEVAKARMARILNDDYKSERVDAVLSPYDGMTIGIIDALKEAGYGTADKPLPITTGQDSETPSVKSIIANEQTQSIFKDTRELAKVAVEQANAILTGSKPMTNAEVNNDVKKVPTYYLYPVQITKNNYKTLLVDSGYVTEDELKA